jgi:murein DD-endopeptidase MepM/ murein hydrolase activator NlpD
MGALDLFPLPASATYSYAQRFIRGEHEGTDIFAPRGTPVLAVFDGDARASDEAKGGQVVYLQGTGPFARRAFYAHLDSVEPPLGLGENQFVMAGAVLGYVGTTGNAQGKAPHLHFGLSNPDARSFADPFPHLEEVDTKRGGHPVDPGAPPDPPPVFNVDPDSGHIELTDGSKALLGIAVLLGLWWLFGDKPRKGRA